MERLGFFVLLCFATLFAQTVTPNTNSVMHNAPRIYLDCDFCDLDFIRTEIPFVNYVRDRNEANVHVLITRQGTAGGGSEFTVMFLGKAEFAGMRDTLRYYSGNTATDDEIRKGIASILKLGVVRYVAHTPVADIIQIHYKPKATTVKVVDKWHNWVFSLNANTFANGQQSTNSMFLNASVSASRITLEWKTRFSLYANYSENNFDVGGQTITSTSNSKGFTASEIKSLGEHWSIGVFGGYSSSSFSNIDYQFSLSPALEYNIYPYSESTHHELRLEYAIKVRTRKYLEETIFYKTREELFNHAFTITLTFNQPWGSTETSLEASQFLHDLSKNRLQLFSQLQFRLFTGFSLRLFGNISMIHDQLSLPLRGASQEEVLLRRKELATTYSYYISFGISYSFGSIYNNVVNPRFGNSNGRFYSVSF